MDYNKFEDRISDWIENSMDIKERREFEKFLKDNPQYQSKIDSVRDAIISMNNTPSLKVSENFDKNLNSKIKALDKTNKASTGIFGFSRQNFAYLTFSVMCIFMLSAYLLQPSNSAYLVADEDISIEEVESEDQTTPEIKDVDILNDVNGSFVSDKD
ncbi:MAG: hypothetical protein L7S51_00770 [Candidatus Marinimicrobia bacterium]|jgi:hypothetical protein|nr:hypothetical protein [Candidatus Neomarinimicrobiota bacterium]|tara:strand:+ start:77 stop:547 length:471 start_codon:yes stop_codon:yes gene_type:complete